MTKGFYGKEGAAPACAGGLKEGPALPSGEPLAGDGWLRAVTPETCFPQRDLCPGLDQRGTGEARNSGQTTATPPRATTSPVPSGGTPLRGPSGISGGRAGPRAPRTLPVTPTPSCRAILTTASLKLSIRVRGERAQAPSKKPQCGGSIARPESGTVCPQGSCSLLLFLQREWQPGSMKAEGKVRKNTGGQ